MNRREIAVMIKGELKGSNLSAQTIISVLKAAEKIILDQTMNGETVTFLGFGSFYSRIVPEHEKTTHLHNRVSTIIVPEKRKLCFKVSRFLNKTSNAE